MKVTCKVLSHIKLDQSYSLLSARDVSVVLELFKAMDVRGEMALDGGYGNQKFPKISVQCHAAATVQCFSLYCRYPVLCVHA